MKGLEEGEACGAQSESLTGPVSRFVGSGAGEGGEQDGFRVHAFGQQPVNDVEQSGGLPGSGGS